VASINLSASTGRAGLKVGDRVRINGTGLYSGDLATIEKLASGAIPSAVVRTDAGRTRQVRTIDLEPVAAPPPPVAAPPPAAAPAPAAAPTPAPAPAPAASAAPSAAASPSGAPDGPAADAPDAPEA
jgi:hypothetical protein